MAEAPRPAAAAPSSPRATDGDADWFVERPPYAREPTVERIARETKHRLYYGPVREARVGHREEQLYVDKAHCLAYHVTEAAARAIAAAWLQGQGELASVKERHRADLSAAYDARNILVNAAISKAEGRL